MNPTKTADISDLHAQGFDLTELLITAELMHDPADMELLSSAGEVFDPDDPGVGVVSDLLDTASERMTDLGNARILVRLAGGDIRWCNAMPGEGWMLWDGSKWRPDTTRAAYRLADIVGEEWRKRAPPENTDMVLNDEEKRTKAARKAILAHANKCESAAGIRNMLEVLRGRQSIAVDASAWDADHFMLNTPDFTYNLRKVRRHPNRRGDLITRSTSVAAEIADAPTWRAFLLRIMGGPVVPPDTEALDDADADPANAAAVEMVAFLQRAAGYALTGDTSEQCMFIAYGTGRNGKGVFLNTIKAILGTYAQGAQVATFVDRKSGGIPNDLAALAGARFVLCSEPNEGAPLDEGLIKTVTGQDTVTARFLNREFFDFIPQFKLWMMTNHKPPIKGTDNGIWRRLRLIPFSVTIPENEVDGDLPEKLKAEHPAILRWMIDGYKEWSAIGLAPPAAVTGASEKYRQEMDVLCDFIDERCELSSVLVTDNAPLYASYVEWAKDNGLRPRSHKWFSQELQRKGIKQAPDRSKGRRWIGINLLVKARQGLFGD